MNDQLWHRLGHPLMAAGRRYCSVCGLFYERAKED
jgi:hypothetical protein